MSSFKSIATHQTVSDEDFRKIMSVPAVEIDIHSGVKVEIVKNTHTLYNEMARSMAGLITKNNMEGNLTKMIIPVGPTPQYPILADICNKEKISLKGVWIFFMDEYLDWESRVVPKSHLMSFAGYMDKNLFSLFDSSLGLNPEQVVWPNPYDLDYNDSKIEGERRIARGHETVYFTYNGTVGKNVSGLFFIDEKVKIIGEVWNCEKSGTSIICVGIAQVTRDFVGQSDEKTWDDIVQDPSGTFKDKDGNEITGDYGLIYNVICH